jgi:hypothetical protein
VEEAVAQPDLPEFTAETTLQPAGRPAVTADEEWLDAARLVLGSAANRGQYGPYDLLTDAPLPRFAAICSRSIDTIDGIYTARLGVKPTGEPAGTIVIFSRRSDFADYVAERTGLPRGYAAFSCASRGIVAVADVDSLDTLAATLTHEIAHLAHRRAFGPHLPPWLSEGLADAIGDTATADEIAPLSGLEGVEAAVDRLSAAIEAGEQLPLQRLLALSRPQFDRGVRSFDYEQSALVGRFLLLDAEFAGPFRAFLQELAAGKPYEADASPVQGIAIDILERRFLAWLQNPLPIH